MSRLRATLDRRSNTWRSRTARLLRPALFMALAAMLSLSVTACSGLAATTEPTTRGAANSASGSPLASAPATMPPAQTLETVTSEIVSPAEIVAAKVSASVVNVRVTGTTVSPFFGQEPYGGVGSGIVYRSDGYILTNDHVVSLNGRPVDSVVVTLATGETLDATIVARDDTHDLALLKVDKTGLIPVIFASSDSVQVGQWAIAIGSPLDYRNSVSVGIVSGLDRDLPSSDPSSPGLSGLLQTDAPISPGNSGGGLFNSAGELTGVPEAYIPPSSGAASIGFAIPADTVASVAGQLLAE